MKGNILILSNNLGGLYSFRKEVVQAIKDANFEVHISVPDIDNPKGVYFSEIGCHVIPTFFDRRGVNPWADFKLFLSYRKLIHQLRPVAVMTYTIKPNVYGGMACRLCGVPQLANVTGLGDAVENGGLMQKLTVTLYRLGLSKAKCVFFQNKSNRDFCINHLITKHDTELLPGSGVNLQHHTYQEYPDDDTIRFLYIGRVIKDKGCGELFEVAKAIKNAHPNVEFQILGSTEGDYQQQLEELIQKGVIRYMGYSTDVRPYIGAVHCTIMPSYHEGMSNVNLESAANGRPVITTNVPGCKETVEDCKTGYLVKPRDAHDLIVAVERFLSLSYEQKKQMGINARKKVEREFDRNIVVKVYLEWIERIRKEFSSEPLDELQNLNTDL